MVRSSCQLAIHNDYCQPFAHKRSSQEHSLDIWYISVFYRDTHKTAQRIHFVVCFTYQTLFKGSKGRFNFIYNIWRLSRVSNKQKYSSLRSHIFQDKRKLDVNSLGCCPYGSMLIRSRTLVLLLPFPPTTPK